MFTDDIVRALLAAGRQVSAGEVVVVREFDVRELLVPDILEFVDHHCQHLGHRVVHTLHLTIAHRVVGAGGNFPNPKKLVDGMGKR